MLSSLLFADCGAIRLKRLPKIRATLSSVEGIERGQMAKGATLACYFRYADMLKVTLRDIFALALPDAMLDEMQSDLTIQQSLKHALDAMVLEQVHRAMHQLEIRGHAITQQAIGEIVQMTPQGLKRYPSVRVVLEQLASNNRDHQQHEADMQVQHLLEQVRSAAILLQARGEPVTQRAIGRVLQIPWSSLRTCSYQSSIARSRWEPDRITPAIHSNEHGAMSRRSTHGLFLNFYRNFLHLYWNFSEAV